MSFSSKGKRSNSFLPNSYLYKYQLSRISWPLGLLLDLDAFKRHSRFLLFKVNQLFNWLSLAIAAILEEIRGLMEPSLPYFRAELDPS